MSASPSQPSSQSPTGDANFRWPVNCLEPGCGQPAEFKVASRWSDGVTTELKTYGLVCRRCLPTKFAAACQKHHDCSLAGNESLAPPNLYRLAVPGTHYLGDLLAPEEVAAVLDTTPKSPPVSA